jgi:hypothetical protein
MLLRCTLLFCLLTAMAAGHDAEPLSAAQPIGEKHLEPLPRLELLHAREPVPLEETKEAAEHRWHVFAAVVNTYPRLESEELIDNLLEPAMKFIAPGFDGFFTVGDLRDQGLLLPPHVGIGYKLSEHLGVFVQGGYSAGKVRTNEADRSIFLLPFHTDLEIKRGAAYLGIGLDYFPWKHPQSKAYAHWGERLKAARPFFGLRYTWTYATYEAKVRLQLRPFPSIGIRLEDAWLVPSINLNVGLEVPVNERSALFVNGGYAFFDKQRHDFQGPVFTVGWKHFF